MTVHIKWIILVFTYFLSFFLNNLAIEHSIEEFENQLSEFNCNENSYKYPGWPESCVFNNTLDTGPLTPAEPVKLGEFPSYVHITFRYLRTDYLSTCGGTILGPKTVMTAAHCLDERKGYGRPYSARIRAGFVDGGSLETAKEAFAIEYCLPVMITNNIVQPGVTDYVILRLEKPLEIDNVNVQAACYNFRRYHVQNALCYVVGFLPSMTLDSRSQLYKIRVKRVPDTTPAKKAISCYKHGGLPSGVTSNLDNSCLIDGGSPIYCINKCDLWVQQYVFGVFSYGSGNETCDRMCFGDFYKISQAPIDTFERCGKSVARKFS